LKSRVSARQNRCYDKLSYEASLRRMLGPESGVSRPRSHLVRLGVLVAALVAAAVPVAHADTAEDLEAARRRLATIQTEANATAAEVGAAEAHLQSVVAGIADMRGRLQQTRQRERELVAIVRARGRAAYTRAAGAHLGVVVAASGALDAARRAQFLDLANEKDSLAARRLSALRSDLREQRRALRVQRDDAESDRERLDRKYGEIEAQLVAAARARDDLIARLEAERAAAAREAAAREAAAREAAAREAAARVTAAREAAARVAAARETAAATELSQVRAAQPVVQQAGGTTSGSAGQVIANPGGGSFQCPVNGSAYSDNYGSRGGGFHSGIDMFAPTGTPLVAVKAGSVNFVPNEGAGGNSVYLSATDGNVYFYAHLSSFVGGARSVAQGEVIGLVGETGNASGPHLHFEIRVGGANGQRINPYPTLQAAGC
jgi:murein DD-endopeptidase MepM/ murein hydrolase activator NlpD